MNSKAGGYVPSGEKEEKRMKRATLTIAFVLCLVLCVFAFASCGKKGAAATTAEQTADATTAAQTTAAPATTTTATPTPPPHEHTPEPTPTVDLKPTCSSPGEQSYYCEECGLKIPGTTEPIDIDPKAHKINEWTVTDPANMFNETGHREGFCVLCEQTIVEEIKYEPIVKTFTGSSGQFKTATVNFADARGDKHFYPTEADPEGNDLYVEYSILWNPTLLNLDGGNGNNNPYIVTRLPDQEPILYWSPTTGIKESANKNYPGAFEWMGRFKEAVKDSEVNTPTGMVPPEGSAYEDFPNIGGAFPADADNLDNGHEWGWHRVGLRYHLDLADEEAVKAGTAGGEVTDYVGTVTVYVDGVALFKLKTPADVGLRTMNVGLFTAESDGEGGIKYSDVDGWVIPFEINQTPVKTGTTAYLVLADVSVTCGKDFAMKVEKVASPEAATFTVADGVDIDAPVFFKLSSD